MCLTPTQLPHPHFNHLRGRYTLSVPCGKCPECIKHRAAHWAIRCQHEMSLSPDNNSFVTLTYDNAKKAKFDYSYVDFQKFIKRLRKKHPIRYIMSKEYGSQHGRLHFHAILFNYYPSRVCPRSKKEIPLAKIRQSPSGFPLFESEELSKLWPFGFHSVAPATVETAYYIASYALSDSSYYSDDGEILSDKLYCSRRPAIGLEFFKKNYKSLIAKAISESRSIPRYYSKVLEELDPKEFLKYKAAMTSLVINDNDDEYARLCNIISSQKTLDLRDKKDLSYFKIQLNEFYQRRFLRERNSALSLP